MTPDAPAPSTHAVSVTGLWVRFGSVDAVRGVDLEVPRGAATALLGRNGAGKSTTMRVLAGVVPPTEGRVLLEGLDLRTETLAAKRVSGYCPDVGGLVPRATPWEHLQLSARLRRLPAGWEPRARDLLERFDLGGAAHRVTAGFSHGMGRRMSVVLAAFHEPAVLLLDEPFDGVDPLGVEATLEVVADARARGAAVLVSTHLRELAVEACQHAIVLRGGSAVAELSADEMGERPVPVATAPSSTSEALRATADVGSLFGFRLAGLRGRARRAAPVALAVLVAITLAAAVGPAFLPAYSVTRADILDILPTAYLGVLVVSVVSAATAGGGRELLPREQAVAFPVSPTTDHLGALLMAPLNIAWLLQCWTVLGATAYGVGARAALPLALLPVVLWLAAATAVAQVVAWCVEWVRRGPRGQLLVRGTTGVVAVVAGALVVTHTLSDVLDHSPTAAVAHAVLDGRSARWLPWLAAVAALLVLLAGSVVLGGVVAGRVARRQVRDELSGETAQQPARPNPASDLLALVRTDRAGIWRSVPMRRGLAVLSVFPGTVAITGGFGWDLLGVFPGLVASGGALLFGVNAWCLDGRGALWRDSLPVSPRLAFAARVLVLGEILLVASAVTLVLATLRAGPPAVSELVAVVCAVVVVTLQVVATSLRWSVRRPYAVDLRSARATPAPPLTMVGYSSRLALTTTFTGLLLNLSGTTSWVWPLVVSVPFLVWSGAKLALTARTWSDPQARARVVATVSG